MNIERGIRGVRTFAIPSVVVGLATLAVVLYCTSMSSDAGSEAMQSLARTAVIGGAIAQTVLVIVLLIPGTRALRKTRSFRVGSSGQSDDEGRRLVPQLFVWLAIGDSGGIFVFLSALLGAFVFGFLPSDPITLALIVGGFALYAACFVFCIILPLAKSGMMKTPV